MSNLYTFLAGFDPYQDDEESMVWENAPDTLRLDAEQRRDFDATVAAIADARRIQAEIEAAWSEHEAAGDGD